MIIQYKSNNYTAGIKAIILKKSLVKIESYVTVIFNIKKIHNIIYREIFRLFINYIVFHRNRFKN
jgi:hypothetical protein